MKGMISVHLPTRPSELEIVIRIYSRLVISNSKGVAETLRDIRTSTYQNWESEENNELNNHI